MNARDLESKVQKIFQAKGYLVDRALFNFKRLPDGKYRANKVDFAHVFDLICYKQNSPILLIQVCLHSKLREHERKIDTMFNMHSCLSFKVLIASIKEEQHGKQKRYVYTYYERLPEGWAVNPYI